MLVFAIQEGLKENESIFQSQILKKEILSLIESDVGRREQGITLMKHLKAHFTLTSKVSSLLLKTLYDQDCKTSTKKDIVEIMLHLIREKSTVGSFEKYLPYLFINKKFSTAWKIKLLRKLFLKQKPKKLYPKLLLGLELLAKNSKVVQTIIELYYSKMRGNLQEQKNFTCIIYLLLKWQAPLAAIIQKFAKLNSKNSFHLNESVFKIILFLFHKRTQTKDTSVALFKLIALSKLKSPELNYCGGDLSQKVLFSSFISKALEQLKNQASLQSIVEIFIYFYELESQKNQKSISSSILKDNLMENLRAYQNKAPISRNIILQLINILNTSHNFQELQSFLYSDQNRYQTLQSLSTMKLEVQTLYSCKQILGKYAKMPDLPPQQLNLIYKVTGKPEMTLFITPLTSLHKQDQLWELYRLLIKLLTTKQHVTQYEAIVNGFKYLTEKLKAQPLVSEFDQKWLNFLLNLALMCLNMNSQKKRRKCLEKLQESIQYFDGLNYRFLFIGFFKLMASYLLKQELIQSEIQKLKKSHLDWLQFNFYLSDNDSQIIKQIEENKKIFAQKDYFVFPRAMFSFSKLPVSTLTECTINGIDLEYQDNLRLENDYSFQFQCVAQNIPSSQEFSFVINLIIIKEEELKEERKISPFLQTYELELEDSEGQILVGFPVLGKYKIVMINQIRNKHGKLVGLRERKIFKFTII